MSATDAGIPTSRDFGTVEEVAARFLEQKRKLIDFRHEQLRWEQDFGAALSRFIDSYFHEFTAQVQRYFEDHPEVPLALMPGEFNDLNDHFRQVWKNRRTILENEFRSTYVKAHPLPEFPGMAWTGSEV